MAHLKQFALRLSLSLHLSDLPMQEIVNQRTWTDLGCALASLAYPLLYARRANQRTLSSWWCALASLAYPLLYARRANQRTWTNWGCA